MSAAAPVLTPSLPAGPSVVRHSLVLAGRAVTKIRRTPEQFLDVTLQPILFVVLFVYLFGGAVAGSTHDYLQYVLPGLLVQTVLFSTISVGVNLHTDIRKGVFDRFRSLPVARSAPLVGAVLAEVVRYATSVVVLMVFGTILGFDITTDPLSALLGCLLVIGFALCLCWASVFLGMVMREAGSIQGVGFLLLFPLTFGSSMFVPVDTMPGWLQAWVHINPVTHVTDAVRGLLTGGEVLGPVIWTVVTAGAMLAIFFPLAVSAYRRHSS